VDQLDRLAAKEQLAYKEIKERLDQLVSQVTQVLLAQPDHLVLQVPLDHKVLQVQQVYVVLRVLLGLQGSTEQLGLQDQPALRAAMDILVAVVQPVLADSPVLLVDTWPLCQSLA
jgi:non-ribosomal peptide synthetase component E (peptide arylation enzyme)